MAQVIQYFIFQIDLTAIPQAKPVELVNHIAQVRAYLLHFAIPLARAVGGDGMDLR